MNKNKVLICFGIALLFMVSCNSGKSPNKGAPCGADSIAVMDSMRPDMPPPPPDGKGRPPHKPDCSATKGDTCQSKNMSDF